MPLAADDIAALYRRHAEAVVAFFARRVLDPEVAVDLTAETFAAALADRMRFRGGSDEEAMGWLYGIARHQLFGWYRRGDVERRAAARMGGERRALTDLELERIEEISDLAEVRAVLRASLGVLSDDVRAAVQLRVVQERSYEEVAQTLAISEQAARARVSRGLRALADQLADVDDTRETQHG